MRSPLPGFPRAYRAVLLSPRGIGYLSGSASRSYAYNRSAVSPLMQACNPDRMVAWNSLLAEEAEKWDFLNRRRCRGSLKRRSCEVFRVLALVAPTLFAKNAKEWGACDLSRRYTRRNSLADGDAKRIHTERRPRMYVRIDRVSSGLIKANAAKQNARIRCSREAPKYCQKAAWGPG